MIYQRFQFQCFLGFCILKTTLAAHDYGNQKIINSNDEGLNMNALCAFRYCLRSPTQKLVQTDTLTMTAWQLLCEEKMQSDSSDFRAAKDAAENEFHLFIPRKIVLTKGVSNGNFTVQQVIDALKQRLDLAAAAQAKLCKFGVAWLFTDNGDLEVAFIFANERNSAKADLCVLKQSLAEDEAQKAAVKSQLTADKSQIAVVKSRLAETKHRLSVGNLISVECATIDAQLKRKNAQLRKLEEGLCNSKKHYAITCYSPLCFRQKPHLRSIMCA